MMLYFVFVMIINFRGDKPKGRTQRKELRLNCTRMKRYRAHPANMQDLYWGETGRVG